MALLLGDVLFQDFEIPDRISGLGGRHAFTKHRLIGGQRVVNAMGPDDGDPAWSGRFQGGDAIGRAQQLDAMRVEGLPVTLSQGSLLYEVVIEEFTYNYEREWQVTYSIRCYVTDVITPAPELSLDGLVNGDLTALTAQVAALPLAVPGVSSALSTVTAALTGVELLTATPFQLQPVVAAVNAEIPAVQAAIDVTDAAIVTTSVAGMIAGNPAPTLWPVLIDQANNSEQQAALLNSLGYLGRLAKNLAQTTG